MIEKFAFMNYRAYKSHVFWDGMSKKCLPIYNDCQRNGNIACNIASICHWNGSDCDYIPEYTQEECSHDVTDNDYTGTLD